MVLRNELKTHLARCADKVVLEHDILKGQCPETGETLRIKGNTEIPKGNYYIPEPTEDWDDEIEINLSLRQEELDQLRRNQQITGTPLRRPNLVGSDSKGISENTILDDDDDMCSTISRSSRTSSLYVDPLKWNTINQNKKTPNSYNNKPKTLGRGMLLKKIENSGSFSACSNINSDHVKPDMQGVRKTGTSRKSFGRGKILKANSDYTSSQW